MNDFAHSRWLDGGKMCARSQEETHDFLLLALDCAAVLKLKWSDQLWNKSDGRGRTKKIIRRNGTNGTSKIAVTIIILQ